jgi:hypothetical protein
MLQEEFVGGAELSEDGVEHAVLIALRASVPLARRVVHALDPASVGVRDSCA